MGYELRRMIRDGAPATWTGPMVHVASEIADSVWADPSQDLGAAGMPVSTIPVSGHWDERGRWRDGLVERTGMSVRAISRALQDLAEAGYEMRVALKTDKNGRPVFATKGHALRLQVPPLPPRAVPQSPPSTASFEPVSSPSTAGFEGSETDPAAPPAHEESPPSTASYNGSGGEPKVAKDATKPAKHGDLRASKPAKHGDPISLKEDPPSLLSGSTSADGGSVEGNGAGHRNDQDQYFQGALPILVRGGASRSPPPSRWRDPQETARRQLQETRRRRPGDRKTEAS